MNNVKMMTDDDLETLLEAAVEETQTRIDAMTTTRTDSSERVVRFEAMDPEERKARIDALNKTAAEQRSAANPKTPEDAMRARDQRLAAMGWPDDAPVKVRTDRKGPRPKSHEERCTILGATGVDPGPPEAA